MCSSGSSLLPLDLEIKGIARALRKDAREASLAKGHPPILSSDSEEEDNTTAPQTLLMRDY